MSDILNGIITLRSLFKIEVKYDKGDERTHGVSTLHKELQVTKQY